MELFIFWIVCVFVGWLIGLGKGQVASGIVWSLFLGPLGVIVVLALPNNVRLARETADLKLRTEELRVQKQILQELKNSRAAAVPLTQLSPPPIGEKEPQVDDFVPENLRQGRRRSDRHRD